MVGLQFTPIMESLGSSLNGIVNYNSYVPGHQISRHRGLPPALREEGGRGEGGPARLLPAAVQLRDRADARAGDHRHEEPGSQGARRLPPQERDEDRSSARSASGRMASGRTRAWCRRSSAASSTRTWSSSASPASRSSCIRSSSRPATSSRPFEKARGGRSRRLRANHQRGAGSPRRFFGNQPCSRSSCCWRRSFSASCSAASTRRSASACRWRSGCSTCRTSRTRRSWCSAAYCTSSSPATAWTRSSPGSR